MRRWLPVLLTAFCGILAANWQQHRSDHRVASPSPPSVLTRVENPRSARDTWGRIDTLADHFSRHGRDFGATSPEDYAAKAWRFRQRGMQGGLPLKRDGEGILRIYDPASGAFGAYNSNGTTRTYFKADRDYFSRQPGVPVSPADVR